jgi:hypothetical protein
MGGMRESVRRTLMKRFPRAWLYRSLLFGSDSHLNTSGWRESVKRGSPCRPDGSPLPWMNFSAIRFLEDRLTKELSLFEYGSGYSTLFYADLVRNVVSVESDPTWFEIISKRVPENAKVLLVEADDDGEYCRAIERTPDLYDVVIVDGRDRVNSFRRGLSKLTDRGVILLDDAMRERYGEARDIAREAGFRSLDFYGLKPKGISTERSTLFYRDDNCLGL